MGYVKQYLRPESLGEALRALSAANGAGRPLAGGTDIIVDVREGRRVVDLLVDIKAIPELVALDFDRRRGLRFGAAVPCYRLSEDADIRTAYPALVDAASLIGGVQIQSRATIGGNLCTSSPAADGAPPLLALGATCLIVGPAGERRMPLERFFIGPRQNILADGELLVALELPPPVPGAGSAYLRFIPRNEMDIAVAGAGAWLRLEGETIAEARLALGAVAPTPLLVEAAAQALVGRPPTRETLEAAVAAARSAAAPISDMRGSARQRIHLAGVLARRALETAIERAQESRR